MEWIIKNKKSSYVFNIISNLDLGLLTLLLLDTQKDLK